MHPGTGEPSRTVLGHRRRGGLLQRLIGEQPPRHIGEAAELRLRPATEPGGLYQYGSAITEISSSRGDIRDQRLRRQPVPGRITQGLPARFGPQVGDIVGSEIQDTEGGSEVTGECAGLTPVTITL